MNFEQFLTNTVNMETGVTYKNTFKLSIIFNKTCQKGFLPKYFQLWFN